MKNIVILLFFVFSTSSAQYSFKTDPIGGAKNSGENNLFRAHLMKNGALVHTIERTIPYDVPFPAVVINESTGVMVLLFVFDGFVEVYTASGKMMWEQNFFKEMGPNYERTITAAPGASSVAFLTSDVTLPNAMVRKYSMDGAKVWETTLPHPMGYEIAMSGDERTIAAGSYVVRDGTLHRSASLLNVQGMIEANIDILFRKAAFSEDGALLALISEKEIVIDGIAERKELVRGASTTGGTITDLLWNGKNVVVQESELFTTSDGSILFRDPVFVEYSSQLRILRRETAENITFKTSSLHITGTGIEFTAGGKTRILFNGQ